MRLTKIYWKRYSRPFFFFIGAVFSALLIRMLPTEQVQQTQNIEPVSIEQIQKPEIVDALYVSDDDITDPVPVVPLMVTV